MPCIAATACSDFKERCNRKVGAGGDRCKRHANRDRFPAHTSALSRISSTGSGMEDPFTSVKPDPITPPPRTPMYDRSPYPFDQSPIQEDDNTPWNDRLLPALNKTHIQHHDDTSAADTTSLTKLQKDCSLLRTVSQKLCTSIARQSAAHAQLESAAEAQKATINKQAETIAQLIEKSNAASQRVKAVTEQRATDKAKIDQLEECMRQLGFLVTGQQDRLNVLQKGTTVRLGHDSGSSTRSTHSTTRSGPASRVDATLDMRMPEMRRNSLVAIPASPSSARLTSDSRSNYHDTPPPSRGSIDRYFSDTRHARSSISNSDAGSMRGGLLDSRHSQRQVVDRDAYRRDQDSRGSSIGNNPWGDFLDDAL